MLQVEGKDAAMVDKKRKKTSRTKKAVKKVKESHHKLAEAESHMKAPGGGQGAMNCRDEARLLQREAVALATPEAPVEIHPSGEVIPAPEKGPEGRHGLLATMTEKPSQLAIDASDRRLDLLNDLGLGTLEMGLDAAMSIQPKNSLESMLSHQAAAAHATAMELMKKSLEQLDQVKVHDLVASQKTISSRAERTVKLINASARLMDTSQRAIKTLAGIRSRGEQAVRVIHQHVQVTDGGQAVVAGSVAPEGGRRQGGEGKKEE